jgi:glycine/D-amino acid oxidase-like deaminating enzyme
MAAIIVEASHLWCVLCNGPQPNELTLTDSDTMPNSVPGGETSSIWYDTFETPTYPALARDAKADVCVVGAGIAGLSTAYMLSKSGAKVIVIDDGPIGGGESGRTTAHLTDAIDDRIYVLEHIHGPDGARKVVASHREAIRCIEEIVRTENIDCDFERVDGYLFLGPGETETVLDDELAAAHRVGLSDVSKLTRLPGVDADLGPCLRFPNQGQFHILRYLSGLAAAVVRLGGRIYCDTKSESIDGGEICKVKTSEGHTISAKAVCVCTNGSITDMKTTHSKQAPYRTYVIGAVVPRGAVKHALWWDTGSPYHYVRLQRLDEPAPDALAGDGAYDALIVGGEDHKTAHADDAAPRWERLERWMRERWPQAREADRRVRQGERGRRLPLRQGPPLTRRSRFIRRDRARLRSSDAPRAKQNCRLPRREGDAARAIRRLHAPQMHRRMELS